jgi:hypothetical protein
MATAFQPNTFQSNSFQILSTSTSTSAVNWILAGITRGVTGQPLGLCNVFVYDSVTDALMGSGAANASGNYTVTLSSSGHNLFAVAYLAGSPDLAGTTVNTLVATSST